MTDVGDWTTGDIYVAILGSWFLLERLTARKRPLDILTNLKKAQRLMDDWRKSMSSVNNWLGSRNVWPEKTINLGYLEFIYSGRP